MRAICETEGWDVGRVFRADEKAGVLRFSEAWSATGSDVERFIENSRDINYAPGVGLAGMAWQSGRLSGRRHHLRLPRRAGRGCPRRGHACAFVFPVNAEGKTIGVLASTAAKSGSRRIGCCGPCK